MALVLCTGTNPDVIKAGQQLLERAGHRVVTAVNENELSVACKEHQFDVAVIGESLGPQMKRHVVELIRQHCPDTKILELYQLSTARSVKDADSWIESPSDTSKELADRVTEMTNAA